MRLGEIPVDRMEGEQSSDSYARGLESCLDAAGADGQFVLSNANARSLADFFVLLDRWDRMSTTVTARRATQEQTAA
jgi:hypothetical protein